MTGARKTFERRGATYSYPAQSIRKPLLETDALFYLHVPKSAGTTFIGIIDQWFVQDEIFPVHYDLRSFREDYTDEQLQQYRFIRGHFPYPMLMRRLAEKPRTFTFLRDPVARFLSNFEMRQRLPDPLVGLQDRLQAMTLDEFLDAPDLMDKFANRATKYFGGVDKSPSGERIPRLDAALERLEKHFEFVGLVERFAESVDLFAYIYALPPIQSFETKNVTPNRTARDSTPQHLMDRVKEQNAMDMAFFEAGVKRFEEDLAAMADERSRQWNIAIESKPTTVNMDLSRVDPGTGWQIGERHPQFGIARWTGPEPTTTVRVAIGDESDLAVTMQVLATAEPEILASAKIIVNGTEVETAVPTALPGTLTATIPRALVAGDSGYTAITLEVSHTVDRGGRALGLCLSGIDISPVG